MVPVVLSDGSKGQVAASEYQQAIAGGFARPETAGDQLADRHPILAPIGAAAVGAAQSATMNLFKPGVVGLESLLGGEAAADRSRQTFRAIEESSPTGTGIGEFGGLLAGGAGLAGKVASKIGTATVGRRLLGAAAGGAAELAPFGAGQQISEDVLEGRDITAENVVGAGLMSGLLGAVGGGALGLGAEGVRAVARDGATVATKAGGLVEAAAEKAPETVTDAAVRASSRATGQPEETVRKLLDPEFRKLVADAPEIRQRAVRAITDDTNAIADSMEALELTQKGEMKAANAERLVSKGGDAEASQAVLEQVSGMHDQLRQTKAALGAQGYAGSPVMNELTAYEDKLVRLRGELSPQPAGGLSRAIADAKTAETTFTKLQTRMNGDVARASAEGARRIAAAEAKLASAVGDPAAEAAYERLLAAAGRDEAAARQVGARQVTAAQKRFDAATGADHGAAKKALVDARLAASLAVQEAGFKYEAALASAESDMLIGRHAANSATAEKARGAFEWAKLEAEKAVTAAQNVPGLAAAETDMLAMRQAAQEAAVVGAPRVKPKAQLAMATDALKRDLGGFTKRVQRAAGSDNPNIGGAAIASLDTMKGQYEQLRQLLENPAVWGDGFASMQRDVNAAWTERIDAARLFEKELMVPKRSVLDPWTMGSRAHPGRVETFMGRLDKPKGDLTYEAHKKWVDSTERFVKSIEEHSDLSAVDRGHVERIKAAVTNLRKETAGVEASLEAVGQMKALEKAGTNVAPMATQAGETFGGLMGAGLGSLAGHPFAGFYTGEKAGRFLGSLLGRAGNVITNPAQSVLSLEKLNARLDGRLGEVFSKFTKGAPKDAAVGMSDAEAAAAIPRIKKLAADTAGLARRVAEHLGTVAEHAPRTALAVSTTAARAVSYLALSLPEDKAHKDLFRKPDQSPVYSPTELATFKTKLETVQDPLSAMQKMLSGQLNRDAIDALKNVYPEIYAKMKDTAVRTAADPDVSLTLQQQAMMSILFEVAVSQSTTPKFVAALQSSHAPAGKSPSAAKTPSKPIKWGISDVETHAQRLESR